MRVSGVEAKAAAFFRTNLHVMSEALAASCLMRTSASPRWTSRAEKPEIFSVA